MLADHRSIGRCTLGCDGELREDTVSFPDGHLLSCSSCDQFVRQIDESRYETAVSQPNSWQGALPRQPVHRRQDQRATGRDL